MTCIKASRLVLFSGIATGGGGTGGTGGQSATPDSEKITKNQKKEGKNQEKRKNWEKRGKIRKERQKLERFFHFAPPPPRLIGLATLLVPYYSKNIVCLNAMLLMIHQGWLKMLISFESHNASSPIVSF